jgi:hypothetical protein
MATIRAAKRTIGFLILYDYANPMHLAFASVSQLHDSEALEMPTVYCRRLLLPIFGDNLHSAQ